MRILWRKALSTLCAASIVLAAFPAIPRAEAVVDPATAMRFFEQHRVVGGADDVLRSYLGNSRRLSPMGVALYRALSMRYNTAEAVAGYQPAFDLLREAGPYNDTQRAATERIVSSFRERFGDIEARARAGNIEDSFQSGALAEALMSGLAAREAPAEPQYQQVALADGSGHEFWDPPETCRRNQEAARARARARNIPYTDPGERDCLAFRMNQHRVLTYNRQLRDIQRAMNQDRPRQVSFIPETGHYNFEMFQYGYWRLKNQYDDIALALKVDRMALMASLLGVQVRDERFYLDATLEATLEARARTTTRMHRGRLWSIFDLVNQRMRARRTYLEGAERAVRQYETDMNRLRNAGTIDNSIADSMTLDEKNALRWLSLAVLATQEYGVRSQLEALDPDSPDSRMLTEALEASPFSTDLRERYRRQGDVLRRRLIAVQNLLAGVRGALIGSDYAASLDMVQAGLNSAQRELSEIGADYSLYIEAPSGAFTAAVESGNSWRNGQLGAPFGEGWTLGNWGVRAWGGLNQMLGTEHGRNFTRVGAQGPQYDRIARFIAAGDIAGARRAAIAMNPDAARRFQEVRLAGGGSPVTDALRIASSLRVNREQVAAVATHNRWARTVGSYLTWTATLALGGPLISGSLGVVSRVASWAGNNLARIPGVGTLVALPARIIEHSALHLRQRVVDLSPAQSQIPGRLQSNFVGSYLYASGIRAVNAAGRQASFTALSGGISTAFTVGQHMFSGDESQFRDLGDAAWQGFEGGVVWANDSFHPMLGYIGVPSSAFGGMRYVSPVMNSLASRGAVGNVVAAVDAAGMRFIGRSIFPKALGLEALGAGEGALRFGTRFFGLAGPAAGRIGGIALQRGSQGLGFTLAMGDQIAKYALFSHGAGAAARELSYRGGLEGSIIEAAPGESEELRLDRESLELERRIKTSQATGLAWEMSPIWLAIPVFPAHIAAQARVGQRAEEGMRQYDQAGRIHEYANAYEGKELPLLAGRPRVPLAQRVFDWSWRTQESSDVWIVTKEARAAGIRKALYEEVGATNGNLAGANPMRFVEIMGMADGVTLKNLLAVGDDVRDAARENLAHTLVANPALAKRILDAQLGSTVEGFGIVSRPVRLEIAKTLYAAEATFGVRVPKDLLTRLGPHIERIVASDRLPKGPAADAMAALRGLRGKSPGLDAMADHIADTASRWREGKYPERNPNNPRELPMTTAEIQAAAADYSVLYGVWKREVQARVQRGEMTAAEANVVNRFLSTMEAVEARFNSFNNGATIRSITEEVIGALKTEYAARPQVRSILSRWEATFQGWKPPASGRVSAAGKTGPWEAAIDDMATALRNGRDGLTSREQKALQDALTEMRNAPWAVRDKGGNPLPGMRPEQFEAGMTAVSNIMKQGKGGDPIRLFQMLKTGGGKTMLTYEILLPFAEADAIYRGMEVTFLTVQSNLAAQARADYFAFGKLSSRMTFDTYEGLKTRIAEGKSQGVKAMRKYWILGDEMDGAALQPALTIGEVTGRITRRSSVYNRIEELDLSIANQLDNAILGRAKSALDQARTAHAEARRIDAVDAPAIEAAADRLLRAAESYRRAMGPEAALRAERGMRDASVRLRTLTENLPASQGESVLAMRRSLGELERTLAQPPPGRAPPNQRLASELQSALRRQSNLMELAGTEQGLQRLMVEARRLRQAGEQRLDRLRRNVLDEMTPEARARVERSGKNIEDEGLSVGDFRSPARAETGMALVAETRLVRAETNLASRMEGVDAGSRVVSLSNRQVALETQIARGEGGPQAAVKLTEVKNQIAQLESGMTPQRRVAHAEHREALRSVHEPGISTAERSVRRTAVAEKSAELSSGMGDGALGPGLQRMRVVSSQLREAKVQAEAGREAVRRYESMRAERSAKGPADPLREPIRRQANDPVAFAKAKAEAEAFTGGRMAELNGRIKTLESDLASMTRTARRTARDIFKETGADILKLVREAPAGFELRVRRLMDQRRRLMESFAGDENPVYSVYRQMKEDAEPIAHNQQLLSPDKAVYNKAADVLLRRIDGGPLLGNFRATVKMTYEVFTGRRISVPIDRVGLTRVYAARLLKAVFADPIMPPGQRENLFWTIMPSLFFPKGFGGRSSWVRAEFLKMVQAFSENPAGIRYDGLTRRVNVVHNGQWFESMDNASRRFWELHYGTDLTLPYTHRSISTIRDLTTDKRANFISFSGTAGQKFREHLSINDVAVAGKGSVAPEGVRMDLRPNQASKISAIREAIEQSALLSRDHVVVNMGADMPPAVRAEVQSYMSSRSATAGKDTGVVRISELPSPATREWLTALRERQPANTNLVVLSVSDTRVLRTVRQYLIRQKLATADEIAMVFSDAEFLRLNRPEAKVHEQMNLDGLNTGTVRVLILDTRVGGRGLDLNYKGDRSGTAAGTPFRGYSNYRMLVIDPHEMSAVHLLQAQGRIDVGRVLPGAHREFSLVMDVRAVQGEAAFRTMMTEAPFFVEMRKDPGLERFARSRGATEIDWAIVHDYVVTLEATGTAEAHAIANRYRAEVQTYLERRQLEVEGDQLRSSSVSDEAATSPGRYPGLLRMSPGQ